MSSFDAWVLTGEKNAVEMAEFLEEVSVVAVPCQTVVDKRVERQLAVLFFDLLMEESLKVDIVVAWVALMEESLKVDIVVAWVALM